MWGYEPSCQEAPGFPGPRCGQCADCAREDEERRERERERAAPAPVPAPGPVRVVALVVDTADQVREGMRARGLAEGVDYTVEAGRVVWSAAHLRRRGWCCNHGCRNCPWRRA